MLPKNNPAAVSGSLKIVWLTGLLLLAVCVLFMTINAHGQWDFILGFRAKKLLALLVVAYAIGVSTLLFQTLTHNPILTPSILGFDALYIFLQTLLVATLGSVGYAQINPFYKFAAELGVMMLGSVLLFRLLLRQGMQDLTRMILIGVIFGVLFRSLSSLLQRLIDPEAFALVQANSFASFNAVNENMLGIGVATVLASSLFIWRARHKLDVYLLGRAQAVNLGIDYQRTTLIVLLWIALLVSTVTAMVGPVSFFGLLVCALVNDFSPSMRHGMRLPLVFAVAALLLVGGQTVFEHFLGMKAVLSVVIEFAGGLMFLYLILRKKNHD